MGRTAVGNVSDFKKIAETLKRQHAKIHLKEKKTADWNPPKPHSAFKSWNKRPSSNFRPQRRAFMAEDDGGVSDPEHSAAPKSDDDDNECYK